MKTMNTILMKMLKKSFSHIKIRTNMKSKIRINKIKKKTSQQEYEFIAASDHHLNNSTIISMTLQ